MGTELAPGFLVAAPALLDPNFKRTVVLLVDHGPEGSLGFVINRPADITLAEMVPALGLEPGDRPVPEAQVLVGGPVAPDTGWVVFEPSGAPRVDAEIVEVSPGVAVSASRELLEAITRGEGGGKLMLVLGYAGWGPAQLDQELAQGAWIPVDLDDRIVFDTDYDDRWSAALRTLGIDPARLTLSVPSES
jgi:putative transcriptional regulator